MDYSAIAQKYGGKPATSSGSSGSSDLSALAAKYGGAPASAPAAPAAPKSFGQQLGDAAGGLVNIINNNPVSKGITSLAALPVQLGAKALGQPDPFAQGVGTGFGSVKPAAVSTYQGKTDTQFATEEAGNAAQTASLFFPYAEAAGLAQKGLTPILGKTIGSGLAKVASGAAGGYGIDVASNLQSGKPLNESLSPGLGTALGSAIPLVGPAVGLAARGTGETLGVSTGAGYGAIKEAFQAASAGGERAKAYTDALRGKTMPEDIVNEADDALKGIIRDRSKAYQTQLADVTKNNTKSFDISPVQKKLNDMLGDFNVEKNPTTGALDFSRSPGLGRYQTDLSKLQDVLDNWGSKPGDRTVVGIDNLKQVIDDFRIGSSDSRKFDSFVTALRNSAQDIIRKEPGYAKLVGDYSEKTGLIKDIQKGLSLGDKASIDTGFRKLTTALRTNNEFRKELIQELDHASGGFLSSKIAGQQLSEALPRGLARQIEGFGAAGAVLSGIGIIPLLKVAAFASPRVVGEIVNALGISKKLFTQLLDHLGAKTAQFPGDRAVNEAAPAVKKYLAENPPSLGLSMKDVNKMTPAERGALPNQGGLGAVPKELGANPAPEEFKGFEDITTKILDDLKGRSTVSKQYVLDALNRADIKQAERDIIKPILDQEGPTIAVKDFADKIKTELLPLSRDTVRSSRYESVSLPDEIAGPVADYKEHIYQSPIKTSAGNTHFRDAQIRDGKLDPAQFDKWQKPENYFAHTRVEDLPAEHPAASFLRTQEADKAAGRPISQNDYEKATNMLKNSNLPSDSGTTRRVIELQSDLFQKGRLEGENPLKRGQVGATYSSPEARAKFESYVAARDAELAKLAPYKNGWQDRIVREEVKQAALDGKTILQFPTGETAMKIEGLGGQEGVTAENAGNTGDTFEFQGQDWTTVNTTDDSVLAIPADKTRSFTVSDVASDRQLHLADDGGSQLFDELQNPPRRITDPELKRAHDWILDETKNLSDDEAKVAFSEKFDVEDLAQSYADAEINNRQAAIEYLDSTGIDEAFVPHEHNDFEIIAYDPNLTEQIPLGQGEIDQDNPIYKYYEKELGKFLKSKYNAERVTDPQGQSWYQINVPKDAANQGVRAFGKAPIGALGLGAAATLGGGAALKLGTTPQTLSANVSPETPKTPEVRGVPITPSDVSELRKVLFAEISNRDPEKQELEARTIINTALNRIPQYQKKGKQLTLAQVLQEPNQYQGYNSKEYKRAQNNLLMPTDQQKIASIDAVLKQLAAGRLLDNTDGAVYYKHGPDGTITYDDSRTLYK